MTKALTLRPKLNLPFDDDSRVKNLWDDDEYLYLEKVVESGCFPIDLDKIAAKNNRLINAEFEKRQRRQAVRGGAQDRTTSSLTRLPVVGPCLKSLRVQREKREKIRTFPTASGRRIRVFEYGKRLISSIDSVLTSENEQCVYVGNLLNNDDTTQRVAVQKIPCRNRDRLRLILRKVRGKEQNARFYENHGLGIRGILDHAVDDKTHAVYVALPLFDCSLADVFQRKHHSSQSSSSSDSSVSSRSSVRKEYEILIDDDLSETGFSIDWSVYRKWSAEKVNDSISRQEMLVGVISAMEALHHVARDISDQFQPLLLNPSNIYFVWNKENGSSSLFIGDFDVALDDGERLRTKPYLAPEVLARASLDVFASNVWSTGVLLFEILSDGIHPFSDVTSHIPKPEMAVLNISRNFPSALVHYENELLKNMLMAMVSKDPLGRPSISAIRQHPFFADVETLVSFMLDLNEIMAAKSVPTDLKLKFEEGSSYVLSKRVDRDNGRSHSTAFGLYSYSFLDHLTCSKEAKLDVLVGLFDSLRGGQSDEYSSLPAREEILHLIDSEFPLFIIHSLSFAVHHLKEYLSLSSSMLLDLRSFDLLKPFALAYHRYLRIISGDEELFARLETKCNYPNRWTFSRDRVSPSNSIADCLGAEIPVIPPKSKVLSLTDMEEREIRGQPWFFADIKRAQAEVILSMPQNLVGTYLIRRSESEGKQLSLSVTNAGGNGTNVVLHYRIFKGKKGFRIHQHSFPTVIKLIRYYHENEIMDEHYRSVKLKYPCRKD